MVKTYSFPGDSDLKLSEHFAVGEFVTSSDYGGDYPSEVPIDDHLVDILEQVYAHFNCDCAVISSGYRTYAVDIDVGGSGYGMHTRGMAADVCFRRNGAELPSRLIACYLQDIGVKGIGYRCGGAENWTHIDTRTESEWFGDETDYSCGYNDYYAYTGTTKTEVYPDGDTGGTSKLPDVAAVQEWLNDNYFAGLVVDGIYGAATKSALIHALQIELNINGANLDVDGIFGEKTKAEILCLWQGDTGKLVYILQGLLIAHSFTAGGFDGIFGACTKAAVIAFQYKYGLEPDGIAGKETFAALCM